MNIRIIKGLRSVKPPPSNSRPSPTPKVSYLVRMVHPPRVAGWVYMMALVGSIRWPYGPWWVWLGLALNCLVWPQVAHRFEGASAKPRTTVLRNLIVDAFLVGAWSSVISYRLFPTACMLGAVALNMTSMGGIRHFFKGMSACLLGAVLSGLFTGFHQADDTPFSTVAISIIGMVCYVSYVGYVAYGQAIRLHTLRKKTHEIAENLKRTQRQFTDAAHHAGMAEVASSVLHNVGNTLNSVSISAEIIHKTLRESQSVQVMERIAALLAQHQDDLGDFLCHDERGKKIPPVLGQTHQRLQQMISDMELEVRHLRQNIFAVSEVLAAHAEHTRARSFFETRELDYLVHEVLRIQTEKLKDLNIILTKQIDANPIMQIEKAKFIQIMINLINNACDALLAHDTLEERRLDLRSSFLGKDHIQLEIKDNGIGIAAEHLTRIFTYGFTTRPEGRGFGLHFCANAVAEMKGTIRAMSPGHKGGSCFILELPIRHPDADPENDQPSNRDFPAPATQHAP